MPMSMSMTTKYGHYSAQQLPITGAPTVFVGEHRATLIIVDGKLDTWFFCDNNEKTAAVFSFLKQGLHYKDCRRELNRAALLASADYRDRLPQPDDDPVPFSGNLI